jgi:cell division protein FtsB
MRNIFYKKSFKKNKPDSLSIFQKQFFKGLFFLTCFSLVIVFIFGDHGLLKLYKIKNERHLIQKKIASLREEREKLKTEKIKIENDLNYIEKIAREKYKMVKPGEKIFKVVDN